MDVWLIALYAVASFLALRSLVSLMAHHKRLYLEELQADDARERRRAAKGARDMARSSERADTAA